MKRNTTCVCFYCATFYKWYNLFKIILATISTGYFSVKMASDTAWSRLMRCFMVAISFNGLCVAFGAIYVN